MKIAPAVTLVTGANRGIGRSIVDALLELGSEKIYATARKPEQLADLVQKSAGRVTPIELDITDRQQVEAAAREAADVTLLINNAGALVAGSILQADPKSLEQDMNTNYFGTLNMIRAFAPVVESNGGGGIANVLSLVSLANMPVIGGYSASKAAAFSLTQAVRAELAPKGISVHNVYPGLVDTDMAAGFEMDKATPSEIARDIISGIEADSEDIFPGEMARQVAPIWASDPKGLERNFGEMVAG